ncbi:MAG: hypothetical protein AABW41_04225 [Nanoarchaeota archaeon]
MRTKLSKLKYKLDNGEIDYDKVYAVFEGWIAYAKHADTYKLRKKFIKEFENMFPNQFSSIEINRILKNLK